MIKTEGAPGAQNCQDTSAVVEPEQIHIVGVNNDHKRVLLDLYPSVQAVGEIEGSASQRRKEFRTFTKFVDRLIKGLPPYAYRKFLAQMRQHLEAAVAKEAECDVSSLAKVGEVAA